MDDQKDELTAWQSTPDGKKAVKRQRAEAKKGGNPPGKRKRGEKEDRNQSSWKRKFKKALGTTEGLAHVMSTLAEAETENAALVAALRPNLPPPPSTSQPPSTPSGSPNTGATVGSLSAQFPGLSTSLQLQSILKKSSEKKKSD